MEQILYSFIIPNVTEKHKLISNHFKILFHVKGMNNLGNDFSKIRAMKNGNMLICNFLVRYKKKCGRQIIPTTMHLARNKVGII